MLLPVVPSAPRDLAAALASFEVRPEPYHPAAAKDALAALAPRLSTYPADKLAVPRLDVRAAALAALAVAALCTQAEPLLARFEQQHQIGEFEIANLTLLRDAAFALLHAHGQADAAGAFATDVRVPATLFDSAINLESRMQDLCEYKFKSDPEIAPLLARLRPGTGYRDIATDLLGYADIYERRLHQVSSDTTNYRQADVREARRIAGEIYAHISVSMSPRAREAYVVLQRTWMLLSEVYAEVQRVGLFLLRSDPRRDERFPSLYAVARPPRSKAKKAPDPAGKRGPKPGGKGPANGDPSADA